jgi:hypothetical protein
LLPLPFGAVYQWTWAGLGSLVGLLVLIAAMTSLSGRGAFPDHVRTLWLPAALYGAVLAWMAVQASGVTPDSWGHAIWRDSAEVLGDPYTAPLSLNPYATWSDLLKLLTYGGVFLLAALYGRNPRSARIGLWLLSIVGALYAAYGLAAYLTGIGETLWRQDVPWVRVGVSSVFLNRNMYADYAAFGFLAVLGLLLDAWLALSKSKRKGVAFWQGLLGGKHGYLLLLPVMGITILSALALTGSRAGGASVTIASLVMFFLMAGGKGSKIGSHRQTIAVGLAVIGAWLFVYFVAGAHVGSRLAETGPGAFDGRLDGYSMILRAVMEAPLTGYGGGTTYDVFYLFNDGSLWRGLHYAHNIYLGAAVELGIPAAVLLFAAVGLIAISCYRGTQLRQRDRVYPALGVALVIHVALHGLVDSPLYLAANAATFSFLMGLAYAQCRSSRRH